MAPYIRYLEPLKVIGLVLGNDEGYESINLCYFNTSHIIYYIYVAIDGSVNKIGKHICPTSRIPSHRCDDNFYELYNI